MAIVCLVQAPPASEFDRHWAQFPILGLAYVAAAVRAAGHEVLVVDGKLENLSVADVVRRVAAFEPDLIGFTCMTVEFPLVKKIAEQMQALSPTPMIIGGAHINATGDSALQECAALDFACTGEGEQVIVELLEVLGGARMLRDVKGIAYRQSGIVVRTPPRDYPPSYDVFPFPAWDLFKVGEQIPILTHRGCPYQCTFCGHNSGFKARFRSVENVLAEIEEVCSRYSPRVIRFEDETFGLHARRTRALLEGILQRNIHRKVAFSAQTRVDHIDAEIISLLRDCNFQMLELGVESGNAEILASIRKGITLEQVDRAVALAKNGGLSVWCKFILGHPNETRRTIRDTIAYATRLNPTRLSVSIMTPYPGTPIHEMAVRGEGGYKMLSRGWADYDKYSAGVLELKDVPLFLLKYYQIQCYLSLYLKNGRAKEFLGLVWQYRRMALQMGFELVSSFSRILGTMSRRLRARPFN